MDINILLFEDFQTLDVFGPAEVLARIDGAHLRFFSRSGGIITSAQGVPVVTEPAAAADMSEILVVPGGRGTRTLAEDNDFLRFLRDWADRARFCLSVCTGSALLARCGVLDGRKATSNKNAMDWVRSTAPQVEWQSSARWVTDGRFYTSSGVSAGIDMALGFVCDRFGRDAALNMARRMEYLWNDNCSDDPFAI